MPNKRPPSAAAADGAIADPSRRNVLRLSGITGLALAGAALLPAEARASADAEPAERARAAWGGVAQSAATTTPIRPPAVPLAVRQPYLSTWLPATLLPGNSPQFWQGSSTGMVGLARIDGVPWLFMGDGKLV